MDTTTVTTKKQYVCTGTCGAVVSEEEYNNGLTVCGAEVCTMKGQPFAERTTTPEVTVTSTDTDEDVVINN